MKFKLLREGVERDSLGNVLSDEQVRYFKNSKVRDRNGNLLVVHHGTYNSFDSFDAGDIGFHFGSYKSAVDRKEFKTYSWTEEKSWLVGKYYLNITNPFVCDFDYESFDGVSIAVVWLFGTSYDGLVEFVNDGVLGETYIPREFSDAKSVEIIKDVVKRFASKYDDWSSIPRDAEPNVIMRKLFLSKGFDGIEYYNSFEDSGSTSYVAFNPEQIKSITNKTPTNSKRIDEDTDTNSLKFPLNEVHDYVLYHLSTERILDLIKAKPIDKVTNRSPLFLLPDGRFISVQQVCVDNKFETSDIVHHYLAEIIVAELIKEMQSEREDLTDHLVDYIWDYVGEYSDLVFDSLSNDLDWIRVNCGSTYTDGRFYCVLGDQYHSAQAYGLLEWLQWGYDTDRDGVLVFSGTDGEQQKFYSFKEYLPEDILKKIKRFYSSRTLYEGIQHLVIDEESDDYDELFVADSVRELKRFMDTTPWDEFKVVDSSDHDGNYYIGNPYRYIHSEILRKADLNGWFPDDNILTLHRSFIDSELILIERGKGQHRGMFGEDWYDYMFIFEDYTILARDDIRHAPLIKQFGKLLEIREFDESEENPEGIVLSEGLNRLAPNAFITDSPYQVRNLLMNKPKLYRILYDSNIDMYMIGDGQEVIHWDLIKAARKQGYYAEMEEFIDELGDLENYVEFGEGGQFLDDEEIDSYLIYMVYSPDDDTFILGEDGYQFRYPLSQGVMFTRDSYLEDCDLYRVLKSMMPVPLTEARKDFSDKYPSVDEAQEYINNNYSTDTLPPTGATFLMPNGLFIDLGASHMTVHQEFDEQVYNDLVEDGDYVGEFGYTDLFLSRLGFIRCNDGSTMGSLLVHLPSQKPTREQYEALEGWLDASLSMDMYNYIIIATDKSTKRYDTGDYMTDELIALIKRYYSSGRLYEDDNTTDTPNESTKVSKARTDTEPTPQDKAQEIKDNIKVSFTKNS